MDTEDYEDLIIENDEMPPKDTSTLPWIEKYRPKKLDDLVSHTDIIKTLKNFLKNKTVPHLLFNGPPGTGKTSTIMAAARELYGSYYSFMVLELNASDERGIETVRQRIKQFVMGSTVFYQPDTKMFKLVILDEIDAMTDDAQAILRHIIEKYTYNARFCLICNYISKINRALQSRCTQFRFLPLNKEQITERLTFITKEEKIKHDTAGLNTIIKRSNGDMRKALNILQSTCMAFKNVTEETVNECIGYPKKQEIKKIMDILYKEDYKKSYNDILKIKTDLGLSLIDIINEIYELVIVKETDEEKLAGMLVKLSLIQQNLYVCASDKLQLAAFVGIFK